MTRNFSSNMAKIIEQINSSNPKIHSYDQMIKMIVDLGSKEGKNSNKSTFQLSRTHN